MRKLVVVQTLQTFYRDLVIRSMIIKLPDGASSSLVDSGMLHYFDVTEHDCVLFTTYQLGDLTLSHHEARLSIARALLAYKEA